MPCSVTMTFTSCSVWSTWLAIGTMQEIAPPLATEGLTNIETSRSADARHLDKCDVKMPEKAFPHHLGDVREM